MRTLWIVSSFFLSWSLVEVHSQTIPYVSFMGQTLVNHSYVDLRLVGRPDSQVPGPSVECHTDLITCCSSYDGIHRGDWYFPNGARLLFPQGTGIYETRDTQRVDLRRNPNFLGSGIYHCDIAVRDGNDTVVKDKVYVGLYGSDGGIYFLITLID